MPDGATSRGDISTALLQEGLPTPLFACQYLQPAAPKRITESPTSPIYGRELLAPLAAVFQRRSLLAGKFTHLFIDNHADAQSLTMDDSRRTLESHFIARFLDHLRKIEYPSLGRAGTL